MSLFLNGSERNKLKVPGGWAQTASFHTKNLLEVEAGRSIIQNVTQNAMQSVIQSGARVQIVHICGPALRFLIRLIYDDCKVEENNKHREQLKEG